MVRLEGQDRTDVAALVFAVETVCHLNPTRMDGRTVKAYLQTCDRVRSNLLGIDLPRRVENAPDKPAG